MKPTTRRARYTRTQIITAHILKHLMTTVPITVGFLIVLGTEGSDKLGLISIAQFWIQALLGLGLMALGAIILNYFEN